MFRIRGASSPYTDSYKYLGHIINSDLTDDEADQSALCHGKHYYSNFIILQN